MLGEWNMFGAMMKAWWNMLGDVCCYDYVCVSFTINNYAICFVCIKCKKKKAKEAK